MTTFTSSEIHKELISITKQLLVESGEPHKKDITLTDSLQRHLGIDSLARAELFQRIEKRFNLNLPDSLLAEADTLADIASYIMNADPTLYKRSDIHSIVEHNEEHANVDPTRAHTLVDLLLMYAEAAPDKSHIYFYDENGQEEIITYGKLLAQSSKIAHSFRELGLKEGETVAIMQPTNPGFFYTFFGALLAGGIPVPIYPPFRMHMLEAYAQQEAKILRSAQVRFLVTFEQAEKLSYLLKGFVPSLKLVTTVDALLAHEQIKTPIKLQADNFAFIQYTSGSTSDPKGVLLTHYNLLSNIHAYGKAINVQPNDIAVSWLPLYHDLGLIGMWLGSLYHGAPLVLMTPFSFLNHPERWLWTIHYHRGTISGAPNFAYELCIRKIDPHLLEGLDLSSWRLAANGAEKVYPKTLDEFAKKFAPYGFKRKALLPVYGLAESTVGLLIPPLDKEFRVDYVDREKFAEEKIAEPTDAKNANSFVACGRPIEGHEIKIVDEEGNTLPDRRVGSLYFRGPSNMQGYFNDPKATAAVYHDGWIDSGDLAYVADKDVFITGRRKDLIIKAGRNIYPAEIEELVGNIAGVRQGCAVAFGVVDNVRGTEQLIVVAETRENKRESRNDIITAINNAMAERLDVVPDRVVLVAPHVVPKTSSGKLQRAACKRMYEEDRLTKFRIPPWLQITRLSMGWLGQRFINGAKIFLKTLYTLYMICWFCLTLPFVYLYMRLASRQRAAQACRLWAKFILRVAFCRVTLLGKENLRAGTPLIYAANHASYVDSVVMLSILPLDTRFVGKKEVFTAPFLKTFAHKLGFLPVDRLDLTKGVTDTKRIEDVLKEGHSILIFPEGTFGYAEGLRPFRLGAFKVAADAHVPICPIALKGTRRILRDDEKLMRPNFVTVTICKPINPKSTEWQDLALLKNEVRSEIAKYCGEASLDFIAPEKVARKQTG